jgi:hypothetical protein
MAYACFLLLQAVVKEGGGPERLVVKLGMEKAAKGNPDFARRMLGLMAEAPNAAAAGMRPGQGQTQEGERECALACPVSERVVFFLLPAAPNTTAAGMRLGQGLPQL